MPDNTPKLVTRLRESKSGRIFHNGRVHAYTGCKSLAWIADYEFALTLEDGTELIVSDAYDSMGFVYRAPDSGSQMTNIIVPLEEGEPDPVGIPTRDELSDGCLRALKPIHESVQKGDTDPDDLDLCRQIFTSPEAMLRAIQREGNLDKARAAILRDIFQIY